MGFEIDSITDRRESPRLACDLPAVFSDYYSEWSARCESVSAGGCFIATTDLFAPGQDLEITLGHPDGDEVKAEGVVRWVRGPGGRLSPGLGIAFDLRRRELIEVLTDFVERLAVSDVETATRYRAQSRPLEIMTVLFPMRGAPKNPTLTADERTFLAWVDGVRTLRDVREQVGPEEWDRICYAPFSLLGKKVLTPAKAFAADAGESAGFAAPARPATQARERNQQAQGYYESAMNALHEGDKRLALTNLRLAIMLAPGDSEITLALEDLES